MNISEMSVRRPVLMTMIYVALIAISVLFIPRLDQAMFPEIDMPYLMVSVECGDADPESIEIQVAKKLEDVISSVENLNKMTSYSRNGDCFIFLEFNYGTDLDDAESDVTSVTSMISRYLPSWVDDVKVFQMNSMLTSGSIMTLSLAGPYSLPELKSMAETEIEPYISRIEGVGQVRVDGGGDREYHVVMDPNRLQAYNLSATSVISALANTNVIGSGGELTEKTIVYDVRTDARYRTIDDIEDTLITTKKGVPVRIRDIGYVIPATEPGASESYLDEQPIVSITVYKNSDASITKVAKQVKKQLPFIKSRLPQNVQFITRRDSSKQIKDTLNEVYSSALYGVLFAALIIFLFLRRVRPTLIIAISMPICILFTVAFMSMFDISVNMVSMAGLILGIGMIVDASIIILENSMRYRAMGFESPVSAILGSKNMFAAIVASTLTTICVFLPEIIYMNDLKMIGQMLKDLIFTVCISLLCSLFVAVTLIPALCSILRITTSVQKPHHGWYKKFDDALTTFQTKMENGYAHTLGFFLDKKRFFFIPLVTLFVFALSIFPKLGFQISPRNDNGDQLNLSLTLPEGTPQEVTKAHIFQMEDKCVEVFPEGSYTNMMTRIDSNEGSISIALPSIAEQKKGQSAIDLREMIRPELTKDPNATWTYSSGQGMGSASTIDIEISSDNTESAYKVAQNIENILRSMPTLTNVSNDLTAGKPQLDVIINQQRAKELGVSAASVGAVLASSVSGQKSTEISTMSASESYWVRVKLDEQFIESKNQVGALLVPTNVGMVRLDSIADIVESTAPSRIQRENKKRINHVTAGTIDGVASSTALSEIKTIFEQELVLPNDVSISYGGDASDFADMKPALLMCVVMALLLVYIVMAAQFESLLNPFIVFCTLPLLLIGVLIIYGITGSTMSMMTFIGIIALIGVVVNNGIVLIDAISREIKEHRTPVKEACLLSAKNRLRPILMTTLTTVISMIPMAFFPGEGAKMMQPIALTFVGGIITGAFLTLYLSPILYAVFNKRKEAKYDDPNTLENILKNYDATKNDIVM